MRVTLDPPVRAGSVAVAAIARTHVFRYRAGCLASKEPVAFLVRLGDDVMAFDIGGAPLPDDRLEAMCPGARAGFLSMTGGEPDEAAT
jgi:hypothetical protein